MRLKALPVSFLIYAFTILSCTKDKGYPAMPAIENGYEKIIGGAGDEFAGSMIVLPDSSVLLTGSTNSFGSGGLDVYLIKLDKQGNTLWTRTFGGDEEDRGYVIKEAPGGGYLILGVTRSFGVGGLDAYLLKVSPDGLLQWQKTYGGASDDLATSFSVLADGSCLISGITGSAGAGGSDVYLVRTDAGGNEILSRTYGGVNDDGAMSICKTQQNTFMVLAGTNSYGAQNSDILLLHINDSCDTINTGMISHPGYEEAHSISLNRDGSFFIAGHTASFGDPLHDFYSAVVNTAGQVKWQRTYGSNGHHDGADNGIQTSDGGYIITGRGMNHTSSSEDIYLVRTDAAGVMKWQKYFGYNSADGGVSVLQAGSCFYVSGYTTAENGTTDIMLVKICE